MLLEDKVAIVTGGGTGIGAKTALTLSRDGAAIVLTGRRLDKLEEVSAEIRAAEGRATTVAGDVSDPDTSTVVAQEAVSVYGSIDIVINNAGLHASPNLLHEILDEEWDRYLAVNLSGPFFMLRATIPHMLKQGGGAIVNVASVYGLVALKNTASYGATKGGLVQLTRSAAIDYADRHIRVNCLCPDLVEPVERAYTTPAQQAQLVEGWLGSPTGRGSTTDEVAQLISFLVGPHSANITGTIIPIDGGYSAR